MGLLFKLLNKTGLYNFARYSPISEALVELVERKTARETAFYRAFLPPARPGDYVLDVGANKGNKFKAFLQLGYRVVGLEPERGALETLRYRFGRNPRVAIIPKGVSDQPGHLTLHVHDPRSGFNTLSDKWVDTLADASKNRDGQQVSFADAYEIETTTLDALLAEHGKPVFIKIDVEGHELAVIRGLTTPVPFLSFEANLPEFLEETKAILTHLDRISGEGYRYRYSTHEKLVDQSPMSGVEAARFLEIGTHRYVELVAVLDDKSQSNPNAVA